MIWKCNRLELKERKGKRKGMKRSRDSVGEKEVRIYRTMARGPVHS